MLYSTLPSYGICCYLMAAPVFKACFAVELRQVFLGYHLLGCTACTLVFYVHFQLLLRLNDAIKDFFSHAGQNKPATRKA